MKGIFQYGPAIEPLFQTYLTMSNQPTSWWSRRPWERLGSLTLIVRHQGQKEGDGNAPTVQAFVQLIQHTPSVRFERCGIESVGDRGGESAIRHVRRH